MAKELVLKEGEVDTRGIVPINRQSFKDKLQAYLHKPFSFIMFLLICLGTALSAAAAMPSRFASMSASAPAMSAAESSFGSR